MYARCVFKYSLHTLDIRAAPGSESTGCQWTLYLGLMLVHSGLPRFSWLVFIHIIWDGTEISFSRTLSHLQPAMATSQHPPRPKKDADSESTTPVLGEFPSNSCQTFSKLKLKLNFAEH